MTGIYKITNTINNKVYVGSSIDIKTRWSNHRKKLSYGIHPNAGLQNDYDLYGDTCFKYDVICECSKRVCNAAETAWTKYYKEDGRCYNISIGTRLSDETKEKISNALSGRIVTDETKNKLSMAAKNRTPEEIAYAAQRRTEVGRSLNDEQIEKMRQISRKTRPLAKLTEQQVLDIKKRIACGEKDKDLAIKFSVSPDCIRNIRTGRRWSWL